MTGLMILSALLPMYGPWLNPGFAAQNPSHRHLYFGAYDPHHHDLDRPHSHAEIHAETPLEQYRSLLSSIVSLPDLDATLQGLVLLVCGSDWPLVSQPDDLWTSGFGSGPNACGIIIAPLTPPPRS